MDKNLEQKIKDQAKEYCKNPSFKGSIPNDRLAPIKEAMYFAGAKAMYELLKERLGNWIEEKCIPVTMEIGEGIVATMPLPESWINKDDGKLPKMAIMTPSGGLTDGKEHPDNGIPEVKYFFNNFKPTGVDGLIDNIEKTKELNDAVIKQGSPMKDATLTENIKVPNLERSVAENQQPEKKTPASKKKNK